MTYVLQYLLVYLGNDLSSIRGCFGLQNLNFLQVVRAGEMRWERMNVVGLEAVWMSASELANFAILNQIIYSYFTQTLDWNLNLLYVYLGHAIRFVTEIMIPSIVPSNPT